MEPVSDRVKKIIVDQLGVEEDLVTPEASFVHSTLVHRTIVPPFHGFAGHFPTLANRCPIRSRTPKYPYYPPP